MGESLSNGNAAVTLLGNSLATGAGLYVLISILGPISGAHLNPVVSLMFWVQNDLTSGKLISYITAQFLGAICGVWITHIMFQLPLFQLSEKNRGGFGLIFSEFLSTLILLSVIKLSVKYTKEKTPLHVALTVMAGYWFTSSTFFSNPAVTIARSLTNTFVGINIINLPGFLVAQLLGFLALSVFWRQKHTLD